MHETLAEAIHFGSLRIGFDQRVLRPRPWTLAQSEWAAELLDDLPDGPVLELCTGAGHIGLAAVASSRRRLVAVDASAAAVEFARANASAAGMEGRVEVRHGDLAEVLGHADRFVLAIADPPWVRSAAVATFPADPVSAIDGGPDGLDLARRCLEVAATHVVPGGSLLLQLGTIAQADVLADEYADHGMHRVETRPFPGRGVVVRFHREYDS